MDVVGYTVSTNIYSVSNGYLMCKNRPLIIYVETELIFCLQVISKQLYPELDCFSKFVLPSYVSS